MGAGFTGSGRRLIGLVLLGALLAGAAGCAVNPVTGERQFTLVSEDQELALGREAFPSLTWQDGGPLQVDEATRGYLDGIVRTLHAVSHRPNLPVDFTLHAASAPNAWAIPGHTGMNRGLLQALENEAQFAFVMGHEMGHVAARHSAQRQTYGVLGALLLGGVGAVLAGTRESPSALGERALGAGALGAQLLLLRYDRSQELEADRLGVLYMARAGYDPREAVRAHQVLQQAVDRYLANLGQRREEPNVLSDLFSTHPRHQVRVSEIEQVIRELPPGTVRLQGDGRFADRWRERTAAVRALAPAYARYDRARLAFARGDLGAARQELAQAMRLADQAQFWTLEGAILVKESRFAEAREAFARALRQYPGYQPALHGLGVAEYALGRDAEAVSYLEESLRLRPGYEASRYVLGLALARLGRTDAAIGHLRAVAEADPRHPLVHGLLARLYEARGDQRAALAAWRAQLRIAPDSPLGLEARRRLPLLAAGLAEPYRSTAARVRLAVPALWELERDGRRGSGGEVVLRREGPPLRARVASAELGAPPDLDAGLDAWVRERLGGRPASLLGRTPGRLGGRPAVFARVESRERGTRVEHLFAAAARGGRVYWVEVAAPVETWQDPAVRREIGRFLDGLEF